MTTLTLIGSKFERLLCRRSERGSTKSRFVNCRCITDKREDRLGQALPQRFSYTPAGRSRPPLPSLMFRVGVDTRVAGVYDFCRSLDFHETSHSFSCIAFGCDASLGAEKASSRGRKVRRGEVRIARTKFRGIIRKVGATGVDEICTIRQPWWSTDSAITVWDVRRP